MDVLCIGTAVMDLQAFPIGDSRNWKEKQRIEKIEMLPGGDGVNQAMALAEDGFAVSLCAAVGEDLAGESLILKMKEAGVDVSFIQRCQSYATGTSLVLVDQEGKRNTFSVKGAHSMVRREELPELDLLDGKGLKAISIASLFSLPVLEKEGLLEYLKTAQEIGILTISDLGSDKFHQGIEGICRFLPYLDFFMPSDYDAMEMTGKDSVEEAAEVFLKKGCKNVIIKCAERGAYVRTKEMGCQVSAPRVKPVNTTGAGDRMVAYFTEEILQGQEMIKACETACRRASLSIAGSKDRERELS